MDAARNPYSPGAGSPPPELAGRASLLDEAHVLIERRRLGRPDKSLILTGLRGVGKTVLLNRMADDATGAGARTAYIEVAEDKDVAAALAPALRKILYELDAMEGLSEAVKRALRVLRSFTGRFSIGAYGFELGIDPEVGTADSGDLDADVTQLLVSVGEAARSRKTMVALIVDEMQYLREAEFAAIIVALHRTSQLNLPVVLIGAALPSIRGLAGNAKSYAERLFSFPEIDALSADGVREAVQIPAERESARFTQDALSEIDHQTHGYPYFVQEWAYQSWNAAATPTIGRNDVERATRSTIAMLDRNFFRVRFDRLTNAEKRYLRAMAELGPGPHRSGDIAQRYGAKVQSVGPMRSQLIAKGMIYSPIHGDTAFTVPLFDEFLKRAIPDVE